MEKITIGASLLQFSFLHSASLKTVQYYALIYA